MRYIIIISIAWLAEAGCAHRPHVFTEDRLTCERDDDCPNRRCRCRAADGTDEGAVSVCCGNDEASSSVKPFADRWNPLGPWNTGDNGLPGDEIRAITADGDRIVWMATRAPHMGTPLGVTQVANSPNWTSYGAWNAGLPGDSISILRWASDGSFLVRTEGQVGRWSPETAWLDYSLPDESAYGALIAPAGSTGTWLAIDAVLYRCSTAACMRFDSSNTALDGSTLQAVESDDEGTVYAISGDHALVRVELDGDSETLSTDGARLQGASSMLVDAQRRVWVAVQGAISYWDGTSWVDAFSKSDVAPGFLAVDPAGWVWGVDSSACRLVGANAAGESRDVAICEDAGGREATGLAFDADGSAWIGTSGAGLLTVHDPHGDSPTVQAMRADGCAAEAATMSLVDGSGRLWAVRETGQVSMRNGAGSWTEVVGTQAIPPSSVVSAPDGTTWLGWDSRVVRYSPGDPSSRTYPTTESVRLLVARDDGVLYVAPAGRVGIVELFNPATGSQSDVSLDANVAVGVPGDDAAWIVADDRIVRISIDGEVVPVVDLGVIASVDTGGTETYRSKLGVPVDACVDRDGSLWVVGGNGVLQIEASGGVRTFYPLDLGILDPTSSSLRAVECDAAGRVWFLQDDALSVRQTETDWLSYPRPSSAPFCRYLSASSKAEALAVDETAHAFIMTSCGVVMINASEARESVFTAPVRSAAVSRR